MKISIASDHGGFELKNELIEFLKSEGIQNIEDFGTFSKESTDYPIYAKKVGNAVSKGEFDRGLLVCGTGVGMSICVNKIPGVRAVVCSEPVSAEYSRLHNNSNILCLGQRIVGSLLAKEILKTWLETDFEAGRHKKRVDMYE